MKRLASFAALGTVLATMAAPAVAEPTQKKIDLPEAIKLATEGNVQVAVAQESIAGAQDKLAGDETLRLPTLSVQGGAQLWNSKIDFSQDVLLCKDTTGVDCPLTDLTKYQLFPVSATIRGYLTASVSAVVSESVTTALLLKTLLKLDDAGISAARAELDTTKLDLAYQAAEAYLDALEVDTLHEIATTSVAQIDADLDRVTKLRDAKVLADVDVLRVEAARDQAQQQVLEAEANGETARAGLALLLGLPDGTELELAPIDMTTPDIAWSEDDAVAMASKSRPERRAAQAHIDQADRGVDLAKGAYLPMVSALANYTHSEGSGFISEPDSEFVGVNVQWNLWDWGKRKHDVSAAKHQREEAKLYAGALDKQLAFDVRAKYRTAALKRKSLDVAQSGQKAADEAYRLQQVKIAAGASTTTDLIDAESDVSRARSQATIAQYQYLIAWMALGRAVGQLPDLPAAK